MKIITYHEKFPVKGVKCYILRKLEEYVVLEKCSRWSMTSLANLNIIRSLDVEKSLWLQVPLIFTFTILEDDLQNYFSLSSYEGFVTVFSNHWKTPRNFSKLHVVDYKLAFCLKIKVFVLSETHLVNERFGNLTMKEKSCKHIYIEISFLNPIRFDPLGTICQTNGLMQKSHWYFALFVKAWKDANK